MSFARPDLLLLLPLLVLAALAAVFAFVRRRRRVARLLAERGLLERIGGAGLLDFPRRRAVLLAVAAAALAVAFAGPRWGTRVAEGRSQSLDVVLALDVSKSMWARDVAPDRLERERLFARRLLRGLAGDRLGLVVFAGRAYVLSPLTVDHSALQLYLDALDPTVVSQGGSSLAAAIVQASGLARGSTDTGADRAIVVISDGEALDDRDAVLNAADRAAGAGIPVYTVGVGTPEGARVAERNAVTGEDEAFKREPGGQLVVSRLDEELLRDVAARTGGLYVRVTDAGAADRLLDRLRALERAEVAPGRRIEAVDRTAWFLLIALLCLTADALLAAGPLRRPVRRRPVLTAMLALAVFTGFGPGDLERGNRLYREGRYAEAVAAYEEALRGGSDSPVLRYNLGTALLRIGRHEEAEQYLRAALQGTESGLRQHASYNLGNRYLEQGRQGGDALPALEAAIAAYKESLRLDPQDVDAKWNLELALREREEQLRSQSSTPEEQGQGGGEEPEPEDEQEGGGEGGSGGSSGSQGQGSPERAPMSEEEAERILSAIEQDERDLARERLQKGQRRTPVRRDW